MSTTPANNKATLKRFIPLIVFFLLVALLAIGLTLNPRMVPSPLIGKPVPGFELPILGEEKTFTEKEFLGHVTLLNVWASWCFACRQEHEVVKELSRHYRVIGLNYKDNKEDATNWLNQYGNPYQIIIEDADGRVSIDFGVYGAPETFLIDEEGIIRHKVIGPLSDQEKFKALMSAMKKLKTVM